MLIVNLLQNIFCIRNFTENDAQKHVAHTPNRISSTRLYGFTLPPSFFAFMIPSCGAKLRVQTSIAHALGELHIHLPNKLHTFLLRFCRSGYPLCLYRQTKRAEITKTSMTLYCKASKTTYTSTLDTVECFAIHILLSVPVSSAWRVLSADNISPLYSMVFS